MGRFEVWPQVLAAGARRWERVAAGLADSADDLEGLAERWVEEPEMAAAARRAAASAAEGAVSAQSWAEGLWALLDDLAATEARVVGDLTRAWRWW